MVSSSLSIGRIYAILRSILTTHSRYAAHILMEADAMLGGGLAAFVGHKQATHETTSNAATTVCAKTSDPPDSSDRAATSLNVLHETQAERRQKPASSDKRLRDRACTGLSYPEAASVAA